MRFAFRRLVLLAEALCLCVKTLSLRLTRVPVFGETPLLATGLRSHRLRYCLSEASVEHLPHRPVPMNRSCCEVASTAGAVPAAFSSVFAALTFESFSVFLMRVPPISQALKSLRQMHRDARIRTGLISPDTVTKKHRTKKENGRLESVCSQHSALSKRQYSSRGRRNIHDYSDYAARCSRRYSRYTSNAASFGSSPF